jgi:hypothetical protein
MYARTHIHIHIQALHRLNGSIVNTTKNFIMYSTVQPRKPELIIRENEPKELPPDVIRGNIRVRITWNAI